MDQLTTLNVSKNFIDTIPNEISKMVSLKNFDCSSNLLESVPSTIVNCISLKVINFSENKIGFASAILNLTGVRELNLMKCNIQEVPDQISGLVNLESLDLSVNENIENCSESTYNNSNFFKLK